MKFSSILLLSLGLVSGFAMAGGTTEAGVGGALGGVLGSVVGQSGRRQYRFGHWRSPGRRGW
jgi:uncharacterized membrane protein